MAEPEITREWLAEQLALCEAATPGPLHVEGWSLFAADRQHATDAHHGKHGVLIGEIYYEADRAAIAAARTGYPAVLRKLMEAMDETHLTPEWLASIGWAVESRGTEWEATYKLEPFWHPDWPEDKTYTRLLLWADGTLIISQGQDESIQWPHKLTTRASVLALPAAIGVGAKGG